MAENLMLDTATNAMINKFNLDENDYSMFKFNDGSKNVTIGMTNGEVSLTAVFPRDYLRLEEMQAWDDSKKEDYVRHHMMNDLEIPEILEIEWAHIIKLVQDNPRGRVEMTEDKLRELEISDGSLEETDAVVEQEESDLNTPVEISAADPSQAEETAEEFEAKVEGKKKPKKKVGKKKK